ncbi:MAG: lytic transglycosylase, partial [Candidatus Fonsibacter sp.]
PIELQMAIIQRESDFDWLAVPEWDKLFKIIPYRRKSSSLGYSQAVNATWEQFQRETDQKYALRISFYDSVDFIGWYINKTNEILKISKKDYFKQYVAYYEGWGNYKN